MWRYTWNISARRNKYLSSYVNIPFTIPSAKSVCSVHTLHFYSLVLHRCEESRDSSVGLYNRGIGVRLLAGVEIPPQRPGRFYGPPNLVSNACLGLFSRRKSSRDVKLTTHFHLYPLFTTNPTLPDLGWYPACRGGKVLHFEVFDVWAIKSTVTQPQKLYI
jgi:hypothetical protein